MKTLPYIHTAFISIVTAFLRMNRFMLLAEQLHPS